MNPDSGNGATAPVDAGEESGSAAAGSGRIADDVELLDLLMKDAKRAPAIYRPGPYWLRKTKSAMSAIRQFGLADFRGASNSIATSYGEPAFVDARTTWNFGAYSLARKFQDRVWPLKRMFDTQVRLTKKYFDQSVRLRAEVFRNSDRVRTLLSKYKVPADSCRGGELNFTTFGERRISNHYLQLIDTMDRVAGLVDLSDKTSFFEIGGGFGAQVHILLENYPGIRKVIYLDIPPNLYVGTQYLKSFYGASVKTYKETRGLSAMRFAPPPPPPPRDSELEIFCIPPWQIECLDCRVDLFHNANSFVEMPVNVVANYAEHVERLLSKERGAISLVSYDSSPFDSDSLPGFFSRHPFERRVFRTLRPRTEIMFRDYIHYVSR